MATDSFKTASSGVQMWDVDANWSAGVPQPGDNATIVGQTSGSSLVTIQATDPSYTVNSLTLTGNASLPESLFVSGRLTVTGATAVSNGMLNVLNNGTLTLTGITTLSNGGSIGVGGSAAGTLIAGTLQGGGQTGLVNVSNGTASFTTIVGQETFAVSAGARLSIGTTSGTDVFQLGGGTTVLGTTGTSLADTLVGSKQAFFDLSNLAYVAGETPKVTQTGTGTGFNIYSVALQSPLGQTLFTFNTILTSHAPLVIVSPDAASGTLVSIACFTPGTLIATPDGEVKAGDMAIGDRVLTLDGTVKPVVWIGRRSYAGRFLARQPHLLPIRIQAGALGDGLPRRDLLVSPCHAMYLGGLLVPAGSLVNGATITQEQRADRVDYVHIELAEHDVIFAEGAPSETFIDDDSRDAFHNAAEYAQLYGGYAAPEPSYCAPRVTDGAALEAVRCRLDPLMRRAA